MFDVYFGLTSSTSMIINLLKKIYYPSLIENISFENTTFVLITENIIALLLFIG